MVFPKWLNQFSTTFFYERHRKLGVTSNAELFSAVTLTPATRWPSGFPGRRHRLPVGSYRDDDPQTVVTAERRRLFKRGPGPLPFSLMNSTPAKHPTMTQVRYGYRRVHVLLQRDGWAINVDLENDRKIVGDFLHDCRSSRRTRRNKTPKRRVKAKLRRKHGDQRDLGDGLAKSSPAVSDGRSVFMRSSPTTSRAAISKAAASSTVFPRDSDFARHYLISTR